MSHSTENTSETANDTAQLNNSTYTIQCGFRVLHDVDVEHIIETQLKRLHNFIGISDKLDEAMRQFLTNPQLWHNTIRRFISDIKGCVTRHITKIKNMQKELINKKWSYENNKIGDFE